MAIDYDHLLNLAIPDVRQTYSERDCIVYALALGLGQDPMDRQQLRFVLEYDLKAFPTFAATLASPGSWARDLDTGIDYLRVVHGDQRLKLHAPLPFRASVIGRTRVTHIIDKGANKGAVVFWERQIENDLSGELLATATGSLFARANGGFDGPRVEPPFFPPSLPDRSADLTCDLVTRSEAALLYRLSGDYNPLHAVPAVAERAGFDRPILHGLATFGIATHAVVRAACDFEVERVTEITGRFSAPMYPGETLRTEIWTEGNVILFRASSLERACVVMNNGQLRLQT